jgi:hypothetical protein
VELTQRYEITHGHFCLIYSSFKIEVYESQNSIGLFDTVLEVWAEMVLVHRLGLRPEALDYIV